MRDELFEELVASVREGGAILRGEAQPARSFEVAAPDVRHIRESYGLSQSEFAALLGISVGPLGHWEQGRRVPQGPARVLLRVAERHPEALRDVSSVVVAETHSPSKAIRGRGRAPMNNEARARRRS
ncbi:MAG: helix-turn-helix domain-containing protein [Armatimonadota bacterium]|nr:helix-turn-helix domain-containing protein [Armatimonadota bacterium]